VACQFGEQIEVTQDQGALGDQGDGMAAFEQEGQQFACPALFGLDGLVGVGVTGEVD